MRNGHLEMVRAIGLGLLVVLGMMVASGWAVLRAGDQNPCVLPDNLTVNCGFDTFEEQVWGSKTLSVPQGWYHFIVSGEPDFKVATDTYWGPPHISLGLESDGMPFTAGVYQRISVTPGVAYQADIGWAGVGSTDFERKLGLDPTGGTDPLAGTVIWGPSDWEKKNSFSHVGVSARATGPFMTLFVWIGHPVSHGMDGAYLDAVGLWPDPSQPAFTLTPAPSATPTRRAPTRTVAAPPATGTPTPPPPTATASSTATATPSPVPTHTLTPSPTSTPSPSPSWTPTPSPAIPTNTVPPTLTPLATAVHVANIVRAQESDPVTAAKHGTQPETAPETFLLIIAAVAVLGALLAGGIALGLWFRARHAGGAAD